MKAVRETRFTFTAEEVKMVRALWQFLSDMEDWEYDDLMNSLNEDMSLFFDCLDVLLHFMEENQE